MDIWAWMSSLVETYGYIGAFLISIFGNFTVFLPVPFTITIYAFGAKLNPLFLGLSCGIGSTLGEFSAYLLGVGGRRVLDERYGNQFDNIKLLIEKYGMMIIFLFAVLPLPDDLLLIPLGMIKYNLRKAMIAMFIGKTIMCTTIAFAGRYSFELVREIFNSSGIFGGITSLIILGLTLYAMIKIDWEKILEGKTSSIDN